MPVVSADPPVDAAPIDPRPVFKAVGERVLAELTTTYPALAMAPSAAPDANYPDLPAIGECARPDPKERAAIEKVVEGLTTLGCKDPDGIIVAQQFVRMKGNTRTKGVWRVVRVKGTKVTKLGEVTGVPEVDWQEWAEENTLRVLVLADIDGDGARDAVLEQTSTEGGVQHYAAELQLVKPGAKKPIKLGTFDAVTSVALTETSKPGALVVGGFADTSDDVKTAYKCITASGLIDCPAAAESARIARKRDVANYFVYGQFPPDRTLPDRTQLAGFLDELEVKGDERARLLALLPEKKS